MQTVTTFELTTRCYSETGKICRDEVIAIDRNDYANGYALYTFDLTADLGDEENFNLMRQGSV